MASATDQIVRKILLRAPRERVWNAISDSRQFGTWFGAEFKGPFVPGKSANGRIVGTKVDAEVAARQKPHTDKVFEFAIDRIEPMDLFSYRWHPYAVEPGIDYSREPMTLVTFELEDAPNGTMLTVTESGFDRIPLERRARAFERDSEGWTLQMTLIEKYLAAHPQG
jgi:uncharacterized protein YndB with AHSA1/START domain